MDLYLKEANYVENTFEPFLNPTTNKRSSSNNNLNLTLHNFDIISQMVSDVPTQIFNSNPTSSARFRLMSNKLNSSVIPEEDIIQVEDGSEENRSNFRKRKLDDSVNLTNSNSDSTEGFGNKSKVAKKTYFLSQFAYAPKDQNDTKKVVEDSQQENRPLTTQSKSDYEKSQSQNFKNLSQALNVKNMNFDDQDLDLDL